MLTTALETPEHSGRVRAVGGYISPKAYFNLPRQRRITKDELLARDKQRSEELQKTKDELMGEIAKLKAMIAAGASNPSPSSAKSCNFIAGEEAATAATAAKNKIAKELVLEDAHKEITAEKQVTAEKEVMDVDPPPPSNKMVK